MNTGNIAVIFGSAAKWVSTPGTREPRDVDVAYSGDEKAAESAARAWAAEHGLEGLPLDMHEVAAHRSQLPDGKLSEPVVHLPSPMGTHQESVSLLDPCLVEWDAVRSISALLRALGDQGCTSLSDYERGARALQSFSVNLQTDDPARRDWDDYVNGARALMAAITHVEPTMWVDLATRSPLFTFLTHLMARGPSEAGIRYAEQYTSGGQAKLFFRYGTEGWEVFTQYGPKRWMLGAADVFLDGGGSFTPDAAALVEVGGTGRAAIGRATGEAPCPAQAQPGETSRDDGAFWRNREAEYRRNRELDRVERANDPGFDPSQCSGFWDDPGHIPGKD